jgi:7,8-didemethyl-8-hydroxy-5-deazariboflavin synthase
MMNSETSFSIKDGSISEILERYQTKMTLSKDDALALLESNDIISIFKLSASLKTRFKKDIITYSRKIFINITNLCRDYCSYCTYRKNPLESSSIMMKPAEVLHLSKIGKKYNCTEALIVAGERPEERYTEAKLWLRQLGYSSLVEYVIDISEKIVKDTVLLQKKK